jgi:uncharacterized membrane protein YeaQ/YmgE (transglycosylase-associated protein family)
MMRFSGLLVIGGLLLLGGVLFGKALGGLVGLLFAALMWMFVGAMAGRLVRGRGYGWLGNMLLGFAGGFTGSIVFHLLGYGGLTQHFIGYILVGILGAVIFVYLMRVIDRNFAR